MAKFLILYNSDTSAQELMANATPEQMKNSMNDWLKWRNEAQKTVHVEFGLPLQAVGRVTPSGSGPSQNHTSGYSILDGASKEEVLALLANHPHLTRDGATIDVLEMQAMPGLDTAGK